MANELTADFIIEKIKAIFFVLIEKSDEFNVDDKMRNFIRNLDENTKLVEIGCINSFTYIHWICAMEEEFDIEFDDDALDYSKIETLKDLVNVVKVHVEGQ